MILEEVHASGADGGVCRAAMNVMGALIHSGSEALKRRWLPQVADGSVKFLAFAVTEADAGTDTSRIRMTARRVGDRFVVNGAKLWISRAAETDLVLVAGDACLKIFGGMGFAASWGAEVPREPLI